MNTIRAHFRAARQFALTVLLCATALSATQITRAQQDVIDPVSHNKDWEVKIETFDDVDMALVPPGCFKMGSQNATAEQPVTKICMDKPFYLDVYEVTNKQFDDKNGVAQRPSYFPDENLPREFVTWFEAADFCALRDARLPTEAEWEFAARGPDSLKFTWGNEFDNGALAFARGRPAEVGSYTSGESWVGAQDLIGNVWEWVNSLYKPYPYKATDGRESLKDKRSFRSARGGGYANYRFTTATIRGFADPGSVSADYGFRCAKDYDAK